MIIGNVVDDSSTKVFKTAESLTGGAFTAVALGSNGVTTADGDSVPLGIVIGEHELPIEAGEDVTIQVAGGGLWSVAESISAGDFLAASIGGAAVKATAGKFIFAQALESATPNKAAKVQIIRAGYAKE